MGGLAAAVRMARRGFRVQVLEARQQAGGLASSIDINGFQFDAGPYILLDRNGLEWSFRALGLELSEMVPLTRLEEVYRVGWADGASVRFHHDLMKTAAGFESQWPGSGARYVNFVRSCVARYDALSPLLYKSHPGARDLLSNRAWRHAPFLASSLGQVLHSAKLPRPVNDAIAIWTHIAGQDVEDAPSVMAFVPALFHTVGAYYPSGGIGRIPGALVEAAAAAGVEFVLGTRVARIRSESGRAVGVETAEDGFFPGDAIVSDSNGVGTYVELLQETPSQARHALEALPLQSPGAIAYLAVKPKPDSEYLRFHIPDSGGPCRLLAIPSSVRPGQGMDDLDGWSPARLIVPMGHSAAQTRGPAGQQEYLGQVMTESWWRELVSEYRILSTRTPCQWGTEFNLYRDSMNPVMTARFMRQGRLAHRSPWLKGLYLAGSATHPGQWVSFCAISGILAADKVCEDLL